jgi:single-strand DNA-binding protein
VKSTITIVGNVGREPEVKFSKNGKAWSKFSVAATERVKKGDQWEDGDTVWYEVLCFGILAEAVADNIVKGNRVIAVGTLKRSDWTSKDGEPRVTLEVHAEYVGVVPFAKRTAATQSRPRTIRAEDMEPPW